MTKPVLGMVLCVSAISPSLLARQTLAAVQTTAQAAKIDSSTPTACLASLRDYVARRQAEAKDMPPSPTLARQLDAERALIANDCAARFDVNIVADRELGSLATLALDGGQLGQAKAAVERALPLKTLAPTDRAATLVVALSVIRRTEPPEDRDARRERMYPRLEQIVAELDSLPASMDQRFDAHRLMLGAYRGDDIDAGIITHATWTIDAARTLSPAERQKAGYALIAPYVDMAEAWAGQGMTDKALDLLRAGEDALTDIPHAAEAIKPEIARLELVGQAGKPITAPQWLNVPTGIHEMDMPGTVTLLEFTAHWCGPCRESYPGINRLRAQFASRGFRVVLATQFWGYFSKDGKTERPLAPEIELERDRAYFADFHLDVPVAIGDQVHPKIVGGQLQYDPAPNPNDTNYRVGGIPQIQIIDRKGIIRRLIVGYDSANEGRLVELIESLLKEK
jgi:thiol-disulfide isomerase/thioredoxin